MSVRVHVCMEDHGKNFRRELVIELTSEPKLDAEGHRDRDEVGDYVVRAINGTRKTDEARFSHRYGDDVYTLVHHAIEAIGVPVDGMTGRR